MNTKLFFATLFFLISLSHVNAQNHYKKLPADINFLATFDTKNLFQLVDAKDVNATLNKLDFFKKLSDSLSQEVHQIEDLGINLASKSYVFTRLTDSVTFIGALIPLVDARRFQAFIPTHKKIHVVDGLQTIYSVDRSIRVSWDENTAYVMTGVIKDNYLDREDVKTRFGLTANPYNSYYGTDAMMAESVDAAEDATYEYDYADTLVASVEDTAVDIVIDSDENDMVIDSTVVMVDDMDYVTDTVTEIMIDSYEDYDTITDNSVLDSIGYSIYEDQEDSYQDETNTAYYQWLAQTDSIKGSILGGWINTEMSNIISGTYKSFTAPKGFTKKSNKGTVAHYWVRSVDELYQNFMPTGIIEQAFGIGSLSKLKYGYEQANLSLDVDENKMKLHGTLGLDRETARIFKKIYGRKLNSKMYKYVDKDALGFLSFSVNSEAYLKYIPQYIQKYYGGFMPKYQEAFSIGATLFDIVVDEKAVGKVFKGDNLFVLNGVTMQEITYTDYEYDEDYNYKQIEKTKMDEIPQLLWMFSSDDMRLFEQLLALGVRQEEVVQEDGIYKIGKLSRQFSNFYVLMKDGIVFLGNDENQIKGIKNNTYSANIDRASKKVMRKNRFAALFRLNKVPALMEDLEVPMSKDFDNLRADLAQYGDFYMTSPGMKGNSFQGELGIEFPNKGENALYFLMDLLERMAVAK
ncbi:hypothetical protein FAZ19_12760 [Sphingobacterium alkalisoli]|uniref:DUF4836 family protein n=1 Tax=Sphingobacterium alkalisoli TaxID=1874115 RepID=A0A4U0H371_9SPHI|nr:hypothetical protein [Sphingobacterium alkalisoli]TJY65966.1 hypothetical protein FAZ19_12760 [Sphingobacterium alkalisoli]GGH17146.1 hypothetical protein GCM10011418_19910 [Sphingobacterium alkalisoli]